VSLEEPEHSPPRILTRVGVLVVVTIEEGVRSARVHRDLVIHTGLGEARVELLDLLGGHTTHPVTPRLWR
jgi:hypothetical protein